MSLRNQLAAAGLTALALGAAAVPAHAAGTVVAKGLDNPRGLTVGPDGTIYVAQAGRAGKTCPAKDQCLGYTGSIGAIKNDQLTDYATGLLSVGGPDGTFSVGADDVAVGPNGAVYAIVTSAPPKDARKLPSKARRQLGRVVRVKGAGQSGGPHVDTIEYKRNPDHTDVNSDPYGLAIAADGTQYVADAGGNTILQVKGGKVSLLAVIPKLTKKAQAVPTVVRIGPDGALYIGVLGGDGTPKNGSVVYRLVPGGKPTVYAKGFSNVTGLAFDAAGALYVSELYRTASKGQPNPDGDVVKVAPDGTRSRIGPVPFAAGVAVAADNSVYVSAFSVLPGSTPKKSPFRGAGGQVVKFAQS